MGHGIALLGGLFHLPEHFLGQFHPDINENADKLAKEAGEKSVGAVSYGSKGDCDEILARLAACREHAGRIDKATGTLQMRAQLIADEASFRQNDDAVPLPASVGTVFDINNNGVVSKIDANLLGENYFGLVNVMSR